MSRSRKKFRRTKGESKQRIRKCKSSLPRQVTNCKSSDFDKRQQLQKEAAKTEEEVQQEKDLFQSRLSKLESLEQQIGQ
jgi:hypothetical protein